MELNINQAAAYLNCSVDTIRRRIRSGQLQARLDDRGRYMITFRGGEPAGGPTEAAESRVTESSGVPNQQAPAPSAPPEWLQEPLSAVTAAQEQPLPPPRQEVAWDGPDRRAAAPTAFEVIPDPVAPRDVVAPRAEYAPLPPQRRSTDPGLNEQIARLREERQELVQELQMWRDEAMAAKVALEELRRLIPQTLASQPKEQRGGFFRRR